MQWRTAGHVIYVKAFQTPLAIGCLLSIDRKLLDSVAASRVLVCAVCKGKC